MYLATSILFLYAETPLHTGTGSGLGAVDLPLQRERITQFPMIQSTGVKGALRQIAEEEYSVDSDAVKAVFGPSNTEHAGAVAPQDARLLLFPVRALKGVFVWVTCADVLNRFRETLIASGHWSEDNQPPEMDDNKLKPQTKEDRPKAWVSDASLLLDGGSIVLEEFDFSAEPDTGAEEWAIFLAESALPQHMRQWQERLKSHLVILPNDDYRDFVKYATEVVTRIKLNDLTKTVEKGALFTQELLPAESLLYIPIHATKFRDRDREGTPLEQAHSILQWLEELVSYRFQIGGDETLGRGIVHPRWLGRGE